MGIRFMRHLLGFSGVLLWNAAEFLWLALRHRGRLPLACRAGWLHRSARRVLRALNITVEVTGTPPTSGLLVSNHLSYVDIPVFAAATPMVFVAKSEVRGWPAFGWFARRAGTIFLRRARRWDVERVTREIRDALAAGQVVMLFPEGTSSDGRQVLPFRSSLLEPACGHIGGVHPATVSYAMQDGQEERDICYYGEMTLLPHLLNLMTKRHVRAQVRFGPALAAEDGRKELARRLQAEVLRLKETASAGLLL